MNLDEAITAMQNGKKVSHEYLLHTQTKSCKHLADCDRKCLYMNEFINQL